MFKKILAIAMLMSASLSFAAVDVNKASAAELDSIKGIGPTAAAKILDERKKGNFKDWNDLIDRVKGIGQANAARFSEAGLTVGGAAYKTATATAAPAASATKAAVNSAKPTASAAKPAASASK